MCKNNVRFNEQNTFESTINYYEKNSIFFTQNTINANLTTLQDRFLTLLKPHSYILDFGCGTGRDTKYFFAKGFKVQAIDGSKKMCQIAANNTNLPVENTCFLDFKAENNSFDGIWACASILHLPENELKSVFKILENSLKPKGIFYSSFKYGEEERFSGERFFNDMTENKFKKFINSFENNFKILEMFKTSDVRPERQSEKWLNIFLQKK